MKIITKSNSISRITLLIWSKQKLVSNIRNGEIIGWFLLISITLACQTKSVSFDSFDSSLWIAETQTCTGYRNDVINRMEAEFDQFIGMSETELIEYLGNPDKTLLYTRGQKFFSYKLDCQNQTTSTRQLRVRFSALDYVNEVLVLD
ncbi:hypothetical protein [Reichenbachiella sp.]|uniref:hypothetical protein n=1 Tax=Reichenbachiella sp. TaxID=2184521 RepID=UPI003BB0F90B